VKKTIIQSRDDQEKSLTLLGGFNLFRKEKKSKSSSCLALKNKQKDSELTRDELTRAMNLMKKLSCNMFQHFLAVASAMFCSFPS
jgi:hypothetical protein